MLCKQLVEGSIPSGPLEKNCFTTKKMVVKWDKSKIENSVGYIGYDQFIEL